MTKDKIKSVHYQKVELQTTDDGYVSLEQVAMITGTKQRLLKVLVQQELINASEENDKIKIHTDEIESLKKMLRLHYDLGVGWTSMPVVLDLLERIDKLENEIKNLKD